MKTPRTDAERRRLKKAKAYPPDPVSADFTRQLETELNQWKANHDNQVKLKSLLINRPDLGDRAPRIQRMLDENKRLESELADHENASNYTSEILDEMNIPSVTSAGEGPGSIGLEQRLDLALLKSKSMETELAAMTALADRLAEVLKGFTDIEYLHALGRSEDSERSIVWSQRDSAERAITAYEKHKKGNTP